MSALECLAVVLAGMGAGAVNAVVGSGTLITFPVLLALGVDPLVANISNNLGLVPGSVSGAWAYRAELDGEGRRLRVLGAAASLGGALGAGLLLWLPATAFRGIVPVFVALALVLVAAQPRLAGALARRRARAAADAAGPAVSGHSGALVPWLVLASAYGGYFGAAQGILYIALLGTLLPIPLQRANALKNVLGAVVNLMAGAVFVAQGAPIDWGLVGLIAVGSVAGGQLGARFGRRLSPPALRVCILAVGSVALWRLPA